MKIKLSGSEFHNASLEYDFFELTTMTTSCLKVWRRHCLRVISHVALVLNSEARSKQAWHNSHTLNSNEMQRAVFFQAKLVSLAEC